MNTAHVHLVLDHLPVILTPAGLVILALGLLRRSGEIVKVGLGVIVAAALFAVPTFLSGDGAAGIVGDLPQVTDDAIERHEEVAEQALIVTGIAGVAAVAAFVLRLRGRSAPRWLEVVTLVLALAASGWLGVTANLGGEIRHSEIRASEVEAP